MGNKIAVNFSGHETFPLRYGWLEKIAAAGDSHDQYTPGELDASAAMVMFGVGKNMVSSMRHWASVVGVAAVAASGKTTLLPMGCLLFSDGVDPYLDRPSSLWALHWRLATNAAQATTWHYAFNGLQGATFEKVTLADDLSRLAVDAGAPKSRSTIERDVDCLLRTYVVSRSKTGGFDEDSLACPLAELGLLARGGDSFRFRIGPKPSLPDATFAFALAEFMEASAANTVSLERVTYEPGSPGRVFKMDERSVAERLARLDRLARRAFVWSDTGGVRQVLRVEAVPPLELLRLAYPAAAVGIAA